MVAETRMDIAGVLSQFPGFSNLPRPKLARLATAISVWRFARRERIYARKDTSKNLHILLRGVVKLSGLNRAEEPILITLLRPGEVFGLSALFPEPIHQFQCEAVTDCVVAKIDSHQLVDTLLGVPFADFQTAMDLLATRSRELVARYSSMFHLSVRDRLLLVFAELASKFGVVNRRGVLLGVTLTHQDLADLVGATRPIITLQLKSLERDGAIVREKRGLILVPLKLSQEGAVDPPPKAFLPSAQQNGSKPRGHLLTMVAPRGQKNRTDLSF